MSLETKAGPEPRAGSSRMRRAKSASHPTEGREGAASAGPAAHEDTAVDVAFEDHVRAVARNLRNRLSQVLVAVGADATQPRAMARKFGLDKTLAWKLSRIVAEENVLEVVNYLPGRAGVDIALRSFEDAGAAVRSLNALRHALAEFDRVIDVHCGDRETLELMLGYMQRDGQERIEAHRKRAFQGNRAIWGVQARVQLCAHFALPNARDPSILDTALVSGLVDLRRLREDTVWPIGIFRQFSDDGTPLPSDQYLPVDAGIPENGLPVLREFSSQPLPPMRMRAAVAGKTVYELAEGPIGNTGAATCITGRIGVGRFKRYRDEHDELSEYMVAVNTPVETLVHDLFMHKDILPAHAPEVAMYSQLRSEPEYPSGGRDRGRLRFGEPCLDLGEVRDIVTPEFPQHSRLVERVIQRMGHSVDEFHCYRFRMRYPPMPVVAMFRHQLLARPS